MTQQNTHNLLFSFLLATLVCTVSNMLWADTLTASRAQPIKEVSHHVKLFFKDGMVTYKVQRTFSNMGKQHEQVIVDIHLPFGAAATGLRINAGGMWFDGELMEREAAREKYQELTGVGTFAPKDPALLEWAWSDRLRLFIFPVSPGRSSIVEYTLSVPTSYADGVYSVTYPFKSESKYLSDPIVTVMKPFKDIDIKVNNQPIAPGQPFILSTEATSICAAKNIPTGVSCAVSEIDVAGVTGSNNSELTIELDIRHTYKSDLKVELVSPSQKRYSIFSKTGKDENDIRLTQKVSLDDPKVNGKWTLIITDNARLDVGSLENWSLRFNAKNNEQKYLSNDTPVFIPDEAGSGNSNHAKIQLVLKEQKRVGARLGRVVAAKKKQFSRLDVEVAKPFSLVPKKPTVIFLVDASISMNESGIAEQLAIANAFLAHVPDAQTEVVLYRRHAKRLFGKLSNSAAILEYQRQTDKRKLIPHNGSAMDEAYKMAVSILQKVTGPRYIVAFTDELLRPGFKNKQIHALLKRTAPQTITHLVVPKISFYEELYRDDERDLSSIPEVLGGIFAEFCMKDINAKKRLKKTALGLVRPVGIDYFQIEGTQYQDFYEIDSTLAEGVSLRLFEQKENAPNEIVLRGKIWGRDYKKRVHASAAFSKRTAGFVFSHDMDEELTDKEKMKVALLGRVVSPVTSYLAIEPGVRPSTAGLEFGVSGYGRGSGGLGGRRGRTPRNCAQLSIQPFVQPIIEQCQRTYSTAAKKQKEQQYVTVQTTYNEIVNVASIQPQNPYQKCVVEGIWQLLLPKQLCRMRDSFPVKY